MIPILADGRAFKIEETGCVVWSGYRDRDGYGQVRFKGKQCRAHRVAYEQFYGCAPEAKLVCHHCDNPSCLNPEHLFLGSASDNMMDAVIKGRAAQTKKSHCAHGHMLAGDNIQFVGNQRHCRTCNREKARKRRAKDPAKEASYQRQYLVQNRDKINARRRRKRQSVAQTHEVYQGMQIS
jgi:hypothetical protein